jgi:YHS domain-containing protein/thiol-disulfide isomerase/thioredoxin
MSNRQSASLALVICVVLSASVFGQTDPIAWHSSLENAKAEARQTGRYVLIHFWTEDCMPCAALDRNVFSQPEVANALKAQFVPVKLNANDNPATASIMGVSRVPTDVILTPDGQIVGKLISPATPMAYIAELTQVAVKHSGQAHGMDSALAAASQPPQLNSVYASLPLSPSSQPAQQPGTPTANPSAAVSTTLTNNQRFGTPPNSQTAAGPSQIVNQHAASPPLAQSTQPAPTVAAAPPASAAQVFTNQFAAAPQAPASSPAGTAAHAGSTVSTIAQTAAPDPRNLRPGAMPLGFDGYCPVSMRNEWRWVAGNPEFGVGHRGRTYWFASAKEQQQFWANPDFYAPALSGIDPVIAIDHRQQVPGKREHSLDYDNLFYLFASEASLQQFTANPERYAAGVREAMGLQRGRSVR